MKTASLKAAVLVASLLAIQSAGFSQGYVAFFNGTISRFSTNSFHGSGPALAAAAPTGSYYFELLVAPSTQNTINDSLTGWTDTGVLGSNTATAGRMIGYTYSDSAGSQIPGYGPTATADFAVLGWSSNLGTTFAAALAAWNNGNPTVTAGTTGAFAFIGLSSVANDVPLAPAGGPYNNVWGASGVGLIQGMVLNPIVPEPGSLALVGLGAFVFLRYRK
jgi:hypothetical protein